MTFDHQSLHKQKRSGKKAPTATNTGKRMVLVSSSEYGSATLGPEGRRDFDGLDSFISSSSSSSSASFWIPGRGAKLGTSDK